MTFVKIMRKLVGLFVLLLGCWMFNEVIKEIGTNFITVTVAEFFIGVGWYHLFAKND